jgi:hypothetical protein
MFNLTTDYLIVAQWVISYSHKGGEILKQYLEAMKMREKKGNYIRACFCINSYKEIQHLHNLLEILEKFDCLPIGPPIMDSGIWMEQNLVWNSGKRRENARLLQIIFPNNKTTLSLDIEEETFLGRGIKFCPENNDPVFHKYKNMIVGFVKELKPKIGQIDFEADLICDDFYANTIASWGNFLPTELVEYMNKRKIEVDHLFDEVIDIDDLGLLTFIHPLMFNSKWSLRHEQLEDVINSYNSSKPQNF